MHSYYTILAALCVTVIAIPLPLREDEFTAGPFFLDPPKNHHFQLASQSSSDTENDAIFLPEQITVTPEQLQANFGNITITDGTATSVSSESNVKRHRSFMDLIRRGVMGKDDRVLWDDKSAPYPSLGRIITIDSNGNARSICSGTLVGPRHVLTAAHCIPWDNPSWAMKFQANYYDGERQGASTASHIMSLGRPPKTVSDCGYQNDYAVLVLKDRLGDTNKYFGVSAFDSDDADKKIWQTFGYPGDKGGQRPYKQEGIVARKQPECPNGGRGLFWTDADGNGGQSGSVLWRKPGPDGKRYLVGVMSVSSSRGTKFVSNAGMVQMVSSIRKEFP